MNPILVILADIPYIGLIISIPIMIHSIWIRLKQMWNRHILVYKCYSCGYKGFFQADKTGDTDEIRDMFNNGRNRMY